MCDELPEYDETCIYVGNPPASKLNTLPLLQIVWIKFWSSFILGKPFINFAPNFYLETQKTGIPKIFCVARQKECVCIKSFVHFPYFWTDVDSQDPKFLIHSFINLHLLFTFTGETQNFVTIFPYLFFFLFWGNGNPNFKD